MKRGKNFAKMNDFEKAQYFAQYWGVNCICNDEFIWRSNETFDTVLSIYNGDLSEWYAQLHPLSSISDQDALELGKIGLESDYDKTVTDEECINYCKKDLLNTTNLFSNIAEILRSKGYAIPFKQYSVEKLIEMGWLRLK